MALDSFYVNDLLRARLLFVQVDNTRRTPVSDQFTFAVFSPASL